jgi:hypothetical protein
MNETFRRTPGAGGLMVNPTLGTVRLHWKKGELDASRWVEEVEGFGYQFGPARKEGSKKSLDLPVRLGVSAAIAINVMLFSVSFYFGLSPDDPEVFTLFTGLSFLLSTCTVLVTGAVTVSGIATFSVTGATTTAEALGEGWLIEWALVMPDAITHTFRQDAALCRRTLYPVISQDDLTQRHSDLPSLLGAAASYQPYIDEAFFTICTRLIGAGRRPYLVIQPSALRECHRFLTCAAHVSPSAMLLTECLPGGKRLRIIRGGQAGARMNPEFTVQACGILLCRHVVEVAYLAAPEAPHALFTRVLVVIAHRGKAHHAVGRCLGVAVDGARGAMGIVRVGAHDDIVGPVAGGAAVGKRTRKQRADCLAARRLHPAAGRTEHGVMGEQSAQPRDVLLVTGDGVGAHQLPDGHVRL